jgi:hypothetical protein
MKSAAVANMKNRNAKKWQSGVMAAKSVRRKQYLA